MRATAALLGLVVVAACGSAQRNAAHPGSGDESAVVYDRSRCSEVNNRVVRLTTREDGKPDIWKVYHQVTDDGMSLEVLVCKQVDLNRDGKVDVITYYDQMGRTAKEEIDLGFSGTFDLTTYYDGGKIVRKEYDRNHDGKIDEWDFFDGDKLVRIERDTHARGRADVWEYYEGGRLDRIGYDTTGSGRVDRWERAPDDADEDLSPTKPTPTGLRLER
jgi:hypothetical protein